MNCPKESSVGKLSFSMLKNATDDMIWPVGLRGIKNSEQQESVRSKRKIFIEDIKKIESVRILGLTALYTLQGGMFSPGIENPYPEINDLEFLHAIILCSDSTEQKYLFDPSKVSGIWKDLKEQCYVASHESKYAKQTRLERLSQTHSAYYRNPYGDEFFDHMVLAITAEYDARYIRNGSVKNIGICLTNLREEIISRFKNYLMCLRVVLHGNKNEKISKFTTFVGNKSDFNFNEVGSKNLSQGLRNALEEYASEYLFELDENWIERHEADGLPMREVIAAMSLNAIDSWDDPSVITKSHPMWTKPIVNIKGKFYLFSPLTLTSFPFSVLSIFLNDRVRLEKIRGWFVENEAKRLLQNSFPSATIIHGGRWLNNKQQMETDLLVLLSGHLMIFEAKGAMLPDRVRQGSPEALKHFLRRVWGKSIQQGNLLSERLQIDNEDLDIFDSDGVKVTTLKPTEILSIARYGVSVEQIGLFMNSPKNLKKEGVLDEDVAPAPCIILSELKIILNVLQTEELRLHYFTRRTDFSQITDFLGDELDLFTIYLQYGFESISLPDNVFMLLGASFSLQQYKNKKGLVDIPKESPLKNSYFFNHLLERLKYRKSEAFLKVALILFDFPLSEQIEFEKNMKLSFRKSRLSSSLPIVVSKMEKNKKNIIICGVLMEGNMDLTNIRIKAHAIFMQYCVIGMHNQGFIFVKILKSKSVYDALYYFSVDDLT